MIIGLTGYAGVGKDEAAKVLVNEFGFVRVAFADPMRTALYALNPVITFGFESGAVRLRQLVDTFGWDGAKRSYPEIRQLLQRFGTEVGRAQFGEDFWVNQAMVKAAQCQHVVFTDCRFENEARAIRKAGGIVVRIVRDGVEAVNAHISDAGLPGHLVNHTIFNDGLLEELWAKVRRLV